MREASSSVSLVNLFENLKNRLTIQLGPSLDFVCQSPRQSATRKRLQESDVTGSSPE